MPYNWRGDVAELLAKHMYEAKRTNCYDFKKEPDLSRKENTFLKRFWKTIDLYKCNDSGQLEIHEDKAKTFRISRNSDITKSPLEVYKQACANTLLFTP